MACSLIKNHQDSFFSKMPPNYTRQIPQFPIYNPQNPVFRHLIFDIRICFGFSASNLGFRFVEMAARAISTKRHFDQDAQGKISRMRKK